MSEEVDSERPGVRRVVEQAVTGACGCQMGKGDENPLNEPPCEQTSLPGFIDAVNSRIRDAHSWYAEVLIPGNAIELTATKAEAIEVFVDIVFEQTP